MFHPLEAIFANRNVYFAGNKDLLCSYCCSLLEFYDPKKQNSAWKRRISRFLPGSTP